MSDDDSMITPIIQNDTFKGFILETNLFILYKTLSIAIIFRNFPFRKYVYFPLNENKLHKINNKNLLLLVLQIKFILF